MHQPFFASVVLPGENYVTVSGTSIQQVTGLACVIRFWPECMYLNTYRYHRRALAEHRGNPGDELAYIDQVVEEDPKNYHAWSHRQWVLQVGVRSACFLDCFSVFCSRT